MGPRCLVKNTANPSPNRVLPYPLFTDRKGTWPLIRNLMVVTNSPLLNVDPDHKTPFLLWRSGVSLTKYSLTTPSPVHCQLRIFRVPILNNVGAVFTILVVFLERRTERQQRVDIICAYQCREHDAQNKTDTIHLSAKSKLRENRGSLWFKEGVYFSNGFRNFSLDKAAERISWRWGRFWKNHCLWFWMFLIA